MMLFLLLMMVGLSAALVCALRRVSGRCSGCVLAGSVEGIVRLAENVEARVERLSVEQLAILNSAEYGVFFCDSEGRNTFVSDPYAEMLGVDASELVGDGWRNFVSPKCAEAYEADWQRAFQLGSSFRMPVTMMRRDPAGDVSEVDVTVRVVAVMVRGKASHYMGIVSEIK